jgi:hypothetical protein
MSSNQGRQSPPPERQTGAQQQDIPAQPNFGNAPSETHAKDASAEEKKGLPSNPTHILEDHAESTTSKGTVK